MIKIDRQNLDAIARAYFSKISKKKRNEASRPMRSYFISNFEDIVLAKPDEFVKIHMQFMKAFNKSNAKSFEEFKIYMSNQYKDMLGDCGYWLAKELSVNTCPYCNSQYTFTIDRNRKIRPQFDHFLPKSEYPCLALSFYNLIPCCSTCNHIKSSDDKELLHPYFAGFGNKFHFKVNHLDYILENKQIDIECVKNRNIVKIEKDFEIRCENNVRTFALNDLYAQHSDYVGEILDKAYAYSDDYFVGITEEFSRMGKSPSEIKRIIFGNYVDRVDHEKRPLSKLTSDVLEQVGFK